jgi:hypothetical protein
MIDQFEAMESKAENWAFDNIKDDKFRCLNCRKWFPLSEAVTSSPNPFSLPICRQCSEDGPNQR